MGTHSIFFVWTASGALVTARILAEMGPIDILINNVGNRAASMAIEAEPLETWQQLLDLNLTSCFLGTKLAGGALRGG